MESTPHDHDLGEVEQLLQSSRPVPTPVFRATLERRLFDSAPSRARRRRGSGRFAFAAAAAAGGLAVTFGAFGLAGTGPLSSDGSSDVRAKDRCGYVTALGSTRTPYILELADGSLEVRFRRDRAERLVKRCR